MPFRARTLFALALIAFAGPAAAQTKIVFGTDWLAEAEHGGFYQALANGYYKAHGLDVTIRMGGPQTNPPQQIAAGLVDFQLSSGSFGAMAMVQQRHPGARRRRLLPEGPGGADLPSRHRCGHASRR